MEFRGRIFLIQSVIAFIIALFFIVTTILAIEKVITNDKFHETRNLASFIANNPTIQKAVKNQDTQAFDQVLRGQKNFDVDLIVIASTTGKRLFHTEEDNEGGFTHNPGFQKALHGETITEIQRGLTGLAIKSRVPVYAAGEVIGVVTVGFWESHVQIMVTHYIEQAIVATLVMLILMLYGSSIFSNYIQRQLSGMTPEQIARAYQLRKGILNSVAEGMIAVDPHGIIMIINRQAVDLLGIEWPNHKLFGTHISQTCYPYDFFMPQTEEPLGETTINVNGETFLASRTMMKDEDKLIGYVISFRRRDTSAMLQLMARQAEKERDALRVVTHEYANNMAVVSGMLEMGFYQKAREFIHKENSGLQTEISRLANDFHPTLAALILGKKRKANELGYSLTIMDGSALSLKKILLTADEVAAVIGNLLDNAFEAISKTDRKGNIELFATDAGKELIIEVSDNGIGIADEDKDSIFVSGFTSKNINRSMHGVGLALIYSLTEKAQGEIVVEDNDPHGTVFSLFIPRVC
ncbi:Sensor histidine kinase DpiB [Vibrio aerogenes CECT 7868]|uniref:histidine kinase n=1 Tax=Vibrio aerogenes CECT 7868 TaxID=1216006 RepID=A0A1M5X4M5_9VIBR|nr:sensor histidine kinase [Vibrio aerogenes]SHH94478.1 Sensor histidine kinase DpiB [Vibrio aerogenes CECT 7868]